MKYAFIAVIALATHAPLAAAEPASARADATNPEAPVPAIRYDSAFDGYRGYRDTPLAPWRDVNDEVARVGGHLGIVRGGRDAGAPASSQAQPSRPGTGRQ